MALTPYLFFNGRCDEAAAFYREAVDAELVMRMTHGEGPEPPPGMLAPGWHDKVMHLELRIGDGSLFCSDGMGPTPARFEGFSLALPLPDERAAQRAFAALADGGEVRMPLAPTFFSPAFGMLVDRFGVGWMVMVQAQS